MIVQEALPRSTDERVSVELAQSSPKPSEDARWKADLEEQGIRTWILNVPRDGKATLEYQLKVSYPQGARLLR